MSLRAPFRPGHHPEVLNPRNMMPEMPQTPAASQSIDLKKDRFLAFQCAKAIGHRIV